MFGLETTSQMKRPQPSALYVPGVKLVGYVLTPRSFDVPSEAGMRLQGKASRAGFKLATTEVDVGSSNNPFRMGLWRALRRLVCARCEPKRMPLSMMNFDDFMDQALSACYCGCKVGEAGLVVERIDHITPDRASTSHLILTLAKAGKHVVGEDGICVSCCHPATKKLLGGNP